MGFTQRQRGQVVNAPDVNQYGQYLIGTTGQIVSRFGNSSTSYADSLRQEHANGLIWRVGYGTSGAPTWVIEATSSAQKVKTLVDGGGIHFDIRWFGAVAGDSSSTVMTANVAAIQAAIDAAAAVQGSVFIPAGHWYINAPLKLVNRQGASIVGVSPQGSSVNYIGAAAQACVLDMTGSQYCLLSNWQISVELSSAAVLTEVLLASGVTNGTASTANSFYRFHASTPGGTETGGARAAQGILFAWAAGDATFVHCNFNQSGASSRPTLNFSNALATGYAAGLFTRTETSPGSGVYNYYSAVSGVAVASAAPQAGCSDFTFVGTEIHQTTGGTATIQAGSISGFRFVGGPISNGGGGYFNFFGTTSIATTNPNQVLLYGCTLYRESGTVPVNAFEFTSDCTLTGMEVLACNLQCSTSVFGDSSATFRPIFDQIFYRGMSAIGGGGNTHIFSFAGSSATSRLKNSDIWCEGKALTIPGTIDDTTTLHNPGVVTCTGGSNNSFYARVGTTANEAMAGNKVGRSWHSMSPAAAVAAATTYYGWDGSVSASDLNYALFPAPFAGTVKNLYLAASGAPGGILNYRATLYKNGSPTSLTAAINGSGTTANDTNTAHAVSFVAGDTLQMRLVTDAGVNLNDVAVSWEVQAAPV